MLTCVLFVDVYRMDALHSWWPKNKVTMILWRSWRILTARYRPVWLHVTSCESKVLVYTNWLLEIEVYWCQLHVHARGGFKSYTHDIAPAAGSFISRLAKSLGMRLTVSIISINWFTDIIFIPSIYRLSLLHCVLREQVISVSSSISWASQGWSQTCMTR